VGGEKASAYNHKEEAVNHVAFQGALLFLGRGERENSNAVQQKTANFTERKRKGRVCLGGGKRGEVTPSL